MKNAIRNNAIRNVDDNIYLNEDRYENPKDISKFLVGLFEKSFRSKQSCCVLDIGCAAGEFLYYMRKMYPAFGYYGIDVSGKLIEKANVKVKGVNFKTHSILEPPYFDGKKFDAVFCSAVTPIFDDIENVIKCILTATKPGSRVYINSVFNPYPVDALILYRTNPDEPWQRGQNRISQKTVNEILEPIVTSYTWHVHKMPFGLPKQEDLMRGWTMKTEDDPYQRVNGIGLIYDASIVEIVI